MVRLFVLVLLLILSACPACTPLRPGGAAALPATGIDGAFSRQAIVAVQGHTVLVGQVLVLRREGRTALMAEIGQLPHSGQGRLRMVGAWDRGRALPFIRAMRAEPFCIGQTRCPGYRTGTLAFTPATFADAARTGFRATLVGPDGVVTVTIPAALFVEARDRARDAGLWPPRHRTASQAQQGI
jgi:hypothetical protein